MPDPSDLPATTLEGLATAPGFGVARVILRPRKARPFFGRHPWVLDSAVARLDGPAADGDVVDLVSDQQKFIARGIYNSQSRIRVRLYSWQNTEALDAAFFRRKLETALSLRRQLGLDDRQGAARLVFSEADGLSGLVVDRYADWLSIQVTSLAMAVRLPQLVEMLIELVHPKGIFIRTEKGVARAEGLELRDELYWGEAPDGPAFIVENDIRYGVDLAQGQKTGFYIDQRENRRVAASYLQNRSVLDLFCYSGGFALNAALHGHAREVLAIDTSAKAIALAKANAELNGAPNVQFEVQECFEVLHEMAANGVRFGGVILDPPKFARSRASLDDALRAYHRLNRLAVEILEPEGILITCSCSGNVTREDFMDMLLGVAEQTKREIQILEQRDAAPDHPQSVTCLETQYLKCFICRVV